MRRPAAWQSDIPADAEEAVVGRNPDGSPARTELWVGGARVGWRLHDEEGRVDSEWPLRDGLIHGRHATFFPDGSVQFEEPYVDGLPHGTTRQWSPDGALVGSSSFVRGTGLDLWWQPSSSRPGRWVLAELMPLVDGRPHGVQRWFCDGQLTLELTWRAGHRHGIERAWNLHGRLRRGHPRYWVGDRQVRRRQYLRAAAQDPTLPPWLAADDAPARSLPPEIAGLL